jgi:hypothetical protein
LRYPHYQTSIEVKDGASGGSVIDLFGKVFGINSRGFEFGGAEFECESHSFITPIREILAVKVKTAFVPPESWERRQMPAGHEHFTFAELVAMGHIVLDVPKYDGS